MQHNTFSEISVTVGVRGTIPSPGPPLSHILGYEILRPSSCRPGSELEAGAEAFFWASFECLLKVTFAVVRKRESARRLQHSIVL